MTKGTRTSADLLLSIDLVCIKYSIALEGRVNTLRPRQHGHHFPDYMLKCIFLNENVWISIKFSLSIIPDGPINNIPALVQIMAWRRLGDKPLSEPMMVLLLTHICVTRPQWVKVSITEEGWQPNDLFESCRYTAWKSQCLMTVGWPPHGDSCV